MTLVRCYIALFALLVAAYGAQGTAFYPESCAFTCSSGKYIEELPEETGPAHHGDNRAYAWAITSLVQTKLNVKALSPPGSARVAAIVGSCLYEAATLHKQKSSWPTRPFGYGLSSNDDAIKYTLDGAGFWAMYSVFGDKPSFDRVFIHHEFFSGYSLRPYFQLIKNNVEFAGHSSGGVFKKNGLHNSGRLPSILAGAEACQKIIEKYTADGFSPDGTLKDGFEPTGYTPVNAPQTLAGITDCDSQITDHGKWQPLCIPRNPYGFGTPDCTPQVFLAPFAGRYTTFALEDGDETTGDNLVFPPPAVGTPKYEKEWKEVLEISANLDDAQKLVAEYWADGPDSTFPPGHCWKIAADASLTEDLDESETAKLLYIVGNAVNDAGIASWRAKTTFDFVRPLQMIQCGEYRGQKKLMWLGPYQGVGLGEINTWRPYQAATFVTPPFAAYTSGHSTFSEAAAEAMRIYFGSDKYRGPNCYKVKEGASLFEPKSDQTLGVTDVPNTGPATIGYVPREDTVMCWKTFTEMSNQSGVSRLYGGIHIRADDVGGKFMGKNAGAGVFKKASKLKTPSDF